MFVVVTDDLGEHRARRVFCFQKIPAIRTPISLVTASDYAALATRAVTSVVNRYYDPTTDEFLSIDQDVATTDQPYVFTNDDPLNAEDPLGNCGGPLGWVCSSWDHVRHGIASTADWAAQHPLDTIIIVTAVGSIIVTGGADAGVVAVGLSAAEEESALSTAGGLLKAGSASASAVQTLQDCTSANLFSCSSSLLQDGIGGELEYAGAPEVIQASASIVMVFIPSSSKSKTSTTTKKKK